MVFYVVYSVPKEYKSRGLIPKRLKALGCRRIYGSFWEVNERKIDEILKVIGDNQPILLRRTRDIRKPLYDGEGNLVDFGSLIVLVYNPENDGNAKIKWLLAKTPYVKLCRSVYAFPQNSDRYERRGGVFEINNLLMLVKEHSKDAAIFSRVVIVNSGEVMSTLIERVKSRVARKTEKILNGYKDLIDTFYAGQAEKKYLVEREKKLYSEFKHLRKLILFYEKWLKIDFTKEMMKIYSVMRKIRLLKENLKESGV
ncbi:MAG: hypothetical protein QXW55_04470 [Candidatus Bathyarchaeia archaeon]